jgi:CHAT domain-containing protein
LACLQLGEPGIDGEPEDNRLYSWELLNANIDAKLVVLSGCNTGFGKLQTAAGIQSLALGFFNAGVRTIASTLWELPDNSASMLSAEFYKGLHKYKSPSKAMNEARLKFLNGPDPVKRHPYFWAGFNKR